MKLNRRGLVGAAAVAVIAAGAGAAFASVGASPSTATFTQHAVNRPDSGGDGNTWAYDALNRTIRVTDNGASGANESFTVQVTDRGSFTAIAGQKTPGTGDAGNVITRAVKGSVSGGITYTITAPQGALKAAGSLGLENDLNAGPKVTTEALAESVFTAGSVVGQPVTGAWSWTYRSQAGEAWTDASTGLSGNITGKLPAPAPYVYAGHVVSVTAHSAVVGWSESRLAWPSANHCVEVYMYGFDKPAGQAHIGFTCDNGNRAADLGYMTGLSPSHSVSLFVRPATGTYASHRPIPGTDAKAHIYVVTPAA